MANELLSPEMNTAFSSRHLKAALKGIENGQDFEDRENGRSSAFDAFVGTWNFDKKSEPLAGELSVGNAVNLLEQDAQPEGIETGSDLGSGLDQGGSESGGIDSE